MPERALEMGAEAAKIQYDRDSYEAALCDWIANGADSEFALSPDEVIAAVGLSAVVWLALLIADLVMFPRTEMTRFVLTQAAPVAIVTASVHTVFFVLFRGLEFQSILGWFGAFTLHLPVIAIALFFPERRRQQLARNEHRIP